MYNVVDVFDRQVIGVDYRLVPFCRSEILERVEVAGRQHAADCVVKRIVIGFGGVSRVPSNLLQA